MLMIEIYTDGSTRKNGDPNSPGSYGIVVVEGDTVIYQKALYYSNGTTNNRMELMAFLQGLNYIADNLILVGNDGITIYSDSQYVINCFCKGWRRKVNQDIWKDIDAVGDKVKELVDLRVEWVKGHADNEHNNLVDQLCTQAYPDFKEPKVSKQYIKIPLEDFNQFVDSFNKSEEFKFIGTLLTEFITKYQTK